MNTITKKRTQKDIKKMVKHGPKAAKMLQYGIIWSNMVKYGQHFDNKVIPMGSA